MARKPIQIDRDKLRAEVRKLRKQATKPPNMPKSSTGAESAEGGCPAFEKLLIEDQVLSALRTEYARRPLSERRAAAEWAYDEAIATSMFTAALARVDPD